tara:strand:- start:687 stop:1289 length:603 start_codon:yes stop_codon:yes gene_type:complete
MYYDTEVWPTLNNEDLWIYDKLILSRKLGYKCGPCGVPVPYPGYYIVRPIINLEGQGKGTEKLWIENDTWNLNFGYFWQEMFIGRHLSIDYHKGSQIRCTEGFREQDSFIHFTRWIKVNEQPKLPTVVQHITTQYDDVNIEMIGGNVIECHLRKNKDFDDDAVEIIPVWEGYATICPPGFIYVHDTTDELPRLGCYKKYN